MLQFGNMRELVVLLVSLLHPKHMLLVLMDFGAEYGGYCADLTRTVPVNGKFARRQKQVYNACLHLHNYAKSILKPGISILKYTDKVGEEATQQFLKIGLLKKTEVKNEDPENRAYRKYLYHAFFFDINTWLNSKYHTCSNWRRSCA